MFGLMGIAAGADRSVEGNMTSRQRVYRQTLQVLEGTGLSRAVAPLTQGIGAVFMLHRVLPASSAAFQPNRHLEVTPEFLRATVERIRHNGYKIISLGEAVDLLKMGYGLDNEGTRYAVLTFDDGFRDNHDIAYPILKELGVPFTIFLTSGFLDRTSQVWWVALERLIATRSLLDLSGLPGAPESTLSCRSDEEKCVAFKRAVRWLTCDLREEAQREAIIVLAERHGLDLGALADELMMTWDDARRLAEDPLVTLGAHTHDHYALARLSPDEAAADIQRGIARMEEELGRRPKYFAYPYGFEAAAGPRDGEIAEAIGFRACLTTQPGVLRATHARNLMLLPRVSLNGHFQDEFMVDQYLTGMPFVLYDAAKWAASGFGLKPRISRLFPSTR